MTPNISQSYDLLTMGFIEPHYPVLKRVPCHICHGLGFHCSLNPWYNHRFLDDKMYYLIKHKKGLKQIKFRIVYQESGENIRHLAELLDYNQEEGMAMVRGLNLFLLSTDSVVGGFENAPFFQE